MKSKMLGLFLVLGLLIVPIFSMELEGQDYTGDFLIEEINEPYPEDTEYFAQGNHSISAEEENKKTKGWSGGSMILSADQINNDTKDMSKQDEESEDAKKI